MAAALLILPFLLVSAMARSDSKRPLTSEDRCEMDPKARFPHPTECHQFYDCSKTWTDDRYFPKYKNECPYPQLFNADTLKCEDYDKVQCGQRTERKYACDYDQNKCGIISCTPCIYRFPNCVGQPDGPTAFENKPWTPYYGECKDGRSVKISTCERDPLLNVAQIFHPVLKKCVTLDAIPEAKRRK